MAKKPLTDRQQEILAALEGRTVAEASKALGIKPAAVYGHIASRLHSTTSTPMDRRKADEQERP
jgi:DNA-binding CsgD family transcriptional regulator